MTALDVQAARSIFDPSIVRRTISTLGLTASIVVAGNPVATAMSTIAADIGGVRYIGWILTSYTLASGAGLLVAGTMIDLAGLRTTFRRAAVLFLLGTLACAVAPSFLMLIVGRTLQGVGAGMIQAVALGSVAAVYPEHLRPRMFAANSMLWGIAGVAAPAVGALATTAAGWRGLFLLNLPCAVAFAAAGWFALPDKKVPGVGRRVDVLGLGLLCIGTGTLLSALGDLRWRSLLVLLAASMVGAIYWHHAGRSSWPVMGRAQIIGHPLWKLHVLGIVVFAIPWGIGAYLPFVTRNALGFSVAAAATSLMSTSAGWLSGSLVAGRQGTMVRQRRTIRAGLLLLLATAMAAAVGYRRDVPAAFVIVNGALCGLGGGLANNVTLSLLPRISSAADVGRNMAALQYFRGFGSAIGQAVTGACLFAGAATRTDGFDRLERALADDRGVDRDLADALASGMRVTYLIAVALSVAAVLALRGVLSAVGEPRN